MMEVVVMYADRVFYDGECGFCQRSVRLLIALDRSGQLFRFAPLQGPTYHQLVPEALQAKMPDSIVVLTPEGRVLTRSAAIAHLLTRAGGPWKLVARLMGLIPAAARDFIYDLIARSRQRRVTCPLIPPHLRGRFDP